MDESNVSESSLKEAFEKEYREGDEKYQGLVQKQAELNTTAEEQETLNRTLTAAVKYLDKTYSHLLEQRTSLRQFSRRLSNRPLPVVHVQPQPKRQISQGPKSQLYAKKGKKYIALDAHQLEARRAANVRHPF